MLEAQNFGSHVQETAQFQKPGKIAFKPAEEQPAAHENTGVINWFRVEEKDREVKIVALPNTTQVDVTSVSIYADEVSAPKMLNFLGYKVDLKAKMDVFKESYIKNYALTKSHNLMVARFAELKTAFYGYLLSLLGCTSEDIRKLQKKAIGDAVQQNKVLFEENEFNGELLAIVGGGGRKQMRTQQKIMNEIRNQLIIQAKNLGLGDYYTSRRIVEIQIEQCRKILSKFCEEKVSLEYQLAYFGAN